MFGEHLVEAIPICDVAKHGDGLAHSPVGHGGSRRSSTSVALRAPSLRDLLAGRQHLDRQTVDHTKVMLV